MCEEEAQKIASVRGTNTSPLRGKETKAHKSLVCLLTHHSLAHVYQTDTFVVSCDCETTKALTKFKYLL